MRLVPCALNRLSLILSDHSVGAKMASTVDTPVHFDPGRQLCINYGFTIQDSFAANKVRVFPSRKLRSGRKLTQDAVYIYVSHLHTRWLGDLLAMEPRTSEVPFEQLVLAGSHDAGMLGRCVVSCSPSSSAR